MKTSVILIGAALALAALAGTHWSAYQVGRADERGVHKAEQANNTVGAERANQEGADAVRDADTALSRENVRLQQELSNARAQLSRFDHVEPASGRVGPRALVDPAYAHAVLDCIRRVRGDAEAASLSGDCARADPERAAAVEPLPARPTS